MFARLSHKLAEYLYRIKENGDCTYQLIKAIRPVWGLKAPQMYIVKRAKTPYAISIFYNEHPRCTYKVLERNVQIAFDNGDLEMVENKLYG